jgi:hypothetical protein
MTRHEQAPLLGLTAVTRKISQLEPLPCNNMDAQAKLKAETGLTETKVIFGWLLNFQRITVALTKNKVLAYLTAINEMLGRRWTLKGELEMNIGRRVHLGQITPFIHNFLSRLRLLPRKFEKKGKLE